MKNMNLGNNKRPFEVIFRFYGTEKTPILKDHTPCRPSKARPKQLFGIQLHTGLVSAAGQVPKRLASFTATRPVRPA